MYGQYSILNTASLSFLFYFLNDVNFFFTLFYFPSLIIIIIIIISLKWHITLKQTTTKKKEKETNKQTAHIMCWTSNENVPRI